VSSRLPLILKAARQLGLPSLISYARYQFGLRSGFYRWLTSSPPQVSTGSFQPVIKLPTQQSLAAALGEQTKLLLEEAAEIIQGKARLFGNEPVPLQLVPAGKLAHWTAYEQGRHPSEVSDIKFLWEPARFGWVFILGRAYHLTGDENYPLTFWKQVEIFLAANPPYQGPNWCSGQEVALRLIAFVFALQVFANSPHTTAERGADLVQAIANHAARIQPTLVYARAQNNNHLLTEAAGLYTAGLALPEHPASHRWRTAGWRTFNQALLDQIASDGSYVQQSCNYHRLMLQATLWVNSLSSSDHPPLELPMESRLRLAAATRWLARLMDPLSGQVPNLGPNDGAYILPLSSCPFNDYRPVLQAATSAYLGETLCPPGPWDEMRLWLRPAAKDDKQLASQPEPKLKGAGQEDDSPHILHSRTMDSWAYLRAACFQARPGHADQLHLDLWWRGLNIALDPGTYLYNTPPPWDNSLARTEVHNTISLDDNDQMMRAGRFLWLDWAQAETVSYQAAQDGALSSITAQHNGFLRLGALHKRRVELRPDGYWIKDELLPCGRWEQKKSAARARLHWLLPDWPWELLDNDSQEDKQGLTRLRIKSPHGWVKLHIQMTPGHPSEGLDSDRQIQLVRAGQLVYGSGQVSPIWGWISPTYNLKVPALSFAAYQTGQLPLSFTSRWIFP
jgi:hypothetical protein